MRSIKKRRLTARRAIRGAVLLGSLALLIMVLLAPSAQAWTWPTSLFWWTTTTSTTLAPTTTTTAAPTATTLAPTTTTTQMSGVADLSGTTLYQQTDQNLTYTGSWKLSTSSYHSGKSAAYTNQTGSAVTVRFHGTSLTLISVTSKSSGKARVTLDGGNAVLVDLYSSRTNYQRAVYSTGVLANGYHTVRIECSGLKNPMSVGKYVYVDAFKVAGELVADGYAPTATTLAPTTTTIPAPTTTTTLATPTTTTTSTTTTSTTTTTIAPTTTTVAPSTTTTAAPTTTTTAAPTTTTTVPTSFDLQAAINAAAAGATINIPDGTHKGPFTITGKNNLTLMGSANAILTATSGDVLTITSSSGIVLNGFTVVGNYGSTTQKGVFFKNGLAGGALRNLSVRDCGFCGIYGNGGTVSNLTITGCSVTHCGEFGLHFQNDSGGYGSDSVLIEDSTFLGFAGVLGYGSHGVYFKVARNITLRSVEAGYAAVGAGGNPSAFSLCQVEGGVVENCVGHNSKAGIEVAQYPNACQNVTVRNSQGYSNTYADLFEIGTNVNIVWENCVGVFKIYK